MSCKCLTRLDVDRDAQWQDLFFDLGVRGYRLDSPDLGSDSYLIPEMQLFIVRGRFARELSTREVMQLDSHPYPVVVMARPAGKGHLHYQAMDNPGAGRHVSDVLGWAWRDGRPGLVIDELREAISPCVSSKTWQPHPHIFTADQTLVWARRSSN